MKKIKILGTGCKKCNELSDKVKAVADSMGIEYEFEKVTDITEIISYGVMTTPALVVDGKVKVSGKIPSDDEIKRLL
jgi:small redox-active disulfide protein 2